MITMKNWRLKLDQEYDDFYYYFYVHIFIMNFNEINKQQT